MRNLLFLFFLLAAGCARIPHQDLAQKTELPSISTSLADVETFAVGEWPSERWWEMFADPELSRLVEEGIKGNPSLQEARARQEGAEQYVRQERARLLPHLSTDYTENWQYLSGNGFDRSFFPNPNGIPIPANLNQIDWLLNFSYEFDFWGKNRDLFAAALGKARAGRAEVAQATLVLATQIAQTYVQLQTLLAEQKVIKARLLTRQALEELTSARQLHGVDALPSVLYSQQSLEGMQQSVALIRQEVEMARHYLAILCGQGPENPLVEELRADFSGPFPLPEKLGSDLLARRPDIQAQIHRVEACAKEIGAARADFYPNVNLLALAGLESLTFGNLFKISSKTGGLQPAIHLPIFLGGKLRAQLKEKEAAFDEAVFHYNALVLQSAQEVTDSLVRVEGSRTQLSLQKERLTLAEKIHQLELSRFEQGIIPFQDVLKTEEELLIQRASLLTHRHHYLLATVQLIKALGGGYR